MKSQKEFKFTLTELGERIYYFRILKNLAPKEIAAMVYLSPEAYRNIERGLCDPSFTKLLRIAQILEVGIHDLIVGRDKSYALKKAKPKDPGAQDILKGSRQNVFPNS